MSNFDKKKDSRSLDNTEIMSNRIERNIKNSEILTSVVESDEFFGNEDFFDGGFVEQMLKQIENHSNTFKTKVSFESPLHFFSLYFLVYSSDS